jgi:hypothetical protein
MISLLVLAVGLVCAGIAIWHSSRVSGPMPADVAHSETTLPSQFSALSPEANALIEAKVKGQEKTLSDYLPGSADARRRLDEISSQSQGEQKHNDDLRRSTPPADTPSLATGRRSTQAVITGLLHDLNAGCVTPELEQSNDQAVD